jgi:hypothetical protein
MAFSGRKPYQPRSPVALDPPRDLYLNLTGEIVRLVGLIEEVRARKYGNLWTVWITTRTGPNGRDDHRFKVPHDQFPQWVVDMFNAEASK